jgi:6,7-dimethyl-8-ribityllumazine synthase
VIKTIEGSSDGRDCKIAVVAALYHEAITNSLVRVTLDALASRGVMEDNLTVYRTPGTFEIPFVCSQIPRTQNVDSIVTLGVLISRESQRFEYLANETVEFLLRGSTEGGTPISMGVLMAETIDQAIAKLGSENNEGAEAAICAIRMANLNKLIKAQSISKMHIN